MSFISKLAGCFSREKEDTRTYPVEVSLTQVQKLCFSATRLKVTTHDLLDHIVMVGIDTVFDEVRAS